MLYGRGDYPSNKFHHQNLSKEIVWKIPKTFQSAQQLEQNHFLIHNLPDLLKSSSILVHLQFASFKNNLWTYDTQPHKLNIVFFPSYHSLTYIFYESHNHFLWWYHLTLLNCCTVSLSCRLAVDRSLWYFSLLNFMLLHYFFFKFHVASITIGKTSTTRMSPTTSGYLNWYLTKTISIVILISYYVRDKHV